MLLLHWEILNSEQARVFPKLNFLKKQNFYLAGGTALALHLGHRTSLDFDFYSRLHFDSLALSKETENRFGNQAIVTLREKDTLFVKTSGIDFSFFWYKYRLLKKPTETDGPLVASLEDIAAMKLVSVTQRPAKRDYVDIFYLLGTFSLEKLFSLAAKKYPNFNLYLAIRALTYFEDLKEEERRRIRIFDKSFSWEKAKEKIFREVKKYQLAMIKR